MMVEEPRAALARLAAERGVSLSLLSRLIGRNPAYVQQHVTRGSPRRLGEEDRATIAAYLGVDEALLGALGQRTLPVARYDIAASAGPGGLVELEVPLTPMEFPPELLATLGVRADMASVIRVAGDSMAPTLLPGDEILIDGARTRAVKGGAIYALRIDDVLMVKRVRPAAKGLEVTSDNPAASSPGWIEGDHVALIGRVMWVGRRL